jgi:hypothetical protein
LGHIITPRPLSSGSFGNLKQNMHLKSSNDKNDPLGLNPLRFRTFKFGLLFAVRVTLDVLVRVVRLCDVGVVFED